MSEAKLLMVVAMAKNGVIGRDGGLPWRLSSDLKRFKALTMGKPLIMGRKTFESLGRPLPGRPHVVVSRQVGDSPTHEAQITYAPSPQLAVAAARKIAEDDGAEAICIIGGGKIYRALIDRADELHVTHVDAEVDGDTMFPAINPGSWTSVKNECVSVGERDAFASRYTVYVRADHRKR